MLGRHLEDCRKVYLVKPVTDSREVAPRILSRLKAAGFDSAAISSTELQALRKEASKNGIEQPTLVCIFHSVSMREAFIDNFYGFQTIEINFYDLEKADLVFKASRFNYYSTSPENTELNRLFAQIRDKFLPGQPNPFSENLRNPSGPS
jgi:hypothetical protein